MPNHIHFDADYYMGTRRDMYGFPIVPRNAPPDNLRSYLELYSREAYGMVGHPALTHAEWDVNLPIPRMRALRGLGTVYAGPVITEMQVEGAFGFRGLGSLGAPVGTDPTLSFPTPGVAKVSTLWAQRGANAWYAARGRATRVVTDGISGPQTLNALKALRLLWLAEMPAPISTSPRVITMPAIVDREHMALAGDFAAAMRELELVPDVVSSAAHPAPEPVVTPDPYTTPSGGASGGVVLAVALGLGAAMWFGRRR